MKTFTTGLVAGAMLTLGMGMLVNPMSKRDMRKVKCRTGRMIRNINRTINDWM